MKTKLNNLNVALFVLVVLLGFFSVRATTQASKYRKAMMDTAPYLEMCPYCFEYLDGKSDRLIEIHLLHECKLDEDLEGAQGDVVRTGQKRLVRYPF